MVTYLITDGHGNYLKHNEFNGQFTPVRNQTMATTWDNRSAAQNIIRSCINKNLRKKYHVEEIENANWYKEPVRTEQIIEVKPELDKLTADKILEWSRSLAPFAELINDPETRLSQLTESLSKVDLQISDINHYIENANMNAYQGYMASKLLQDSFKLRRAIKNEQNLLKSAYNNGQGNGTFAKIREAVKKITDFHYTPRELPELFE